MASKYNTDIKRNIGKIENRGKEGYTKLGLPRKKLGRPVDPYKDLPLLEQRKIAEILGTWDKAIELQEKVIEKQASLFKHFVQSVNFA